MATLIEHFNHDFKDLSIDTDIPITVTKKADPTITDSIIVKQRIRQHNESSSRFFTFYIPETIFTLDICQNILSKIDELKKNADGIGVYGKFTGDRTVGTHKSHYSTRLYFYSETLLTPAELLSLENTANEKGFYLTMRSKDYLSTKDSLEKPLAFISHDSRDKDLIGRPLAQGLSSRLTPVWYDEYSLKIGDSLRESIADGIKNTKKCILVLTPNYLNNTGWTKEEFSSVFTKEMVMNEKVVLPIWHGVTRKEVYEYYPSLADRVALIWPSAEKLTEAEYKKEVEILISKIHTEITS